MTSIASPAPLLSFACVREPSPLPISLSGGRPTRGLPPCPESWVRRSSDEPLVGEPLSGTGHHEAVQALHRVSRDVPLVEAKRKFIDVAEQVLFAGVMVDAMQPAFQDGPDTLDGVSGDRTTGKLSGAVVDPLVTIEQAVQVVVRAVLIGVDRRANFHRAVDLVLDSVDAGRVNHHGDGTASAFPHSQHGGFADRPTARVQLFAGVLVAFFSADESLVNLDNPAKRFQLTSASFAETAQNEPRGLLRDADLFSELHRGNPLPRRHEQVHRVQPLVQRNVGSLEDGVRADGEYFVARVAPVVASGAGGNAIASRAEGTLDTSRPEPRFEVKSRGFGIWEQLEQLERADGGARHLFDLRTQAKIGVGSDDFIGVRDDHYVGIGERSVTVSLRARSIQVALVNRLASSTLRAHGHTLRTANLLCSFACHGLEAPFCILFNLQERRCANVGVLHRLNFIFPHQVSKERFSLALCADYALTIPGAHEQCWRTRLSTNLDAKPCTLAGGAGFPLPFDGDKNGLHLLRHPWKIAEPIPVIILRDPSHVASVERGKSGLRHFQRVFHIFPLVVKELIPGFWRLHDAFHFFDDFLEFESRGGRERIGASGDEGHQHAFLYFAAYFRNPGAELQSLFVAEAITGFQRHRDARRTVRLGFVVVAPFSDAPKFLHGADERLRIVVFQVVLRFGDRQFNVHGVSPSQRGQDVCYSSIVAEFSMEVKFIIPIERERDSRSSRDGARFRVKVHAQPGSPALLMSTRNCQSVVGAKREAEAIFGDLDWRDEMGEIRSSAFLEME